MLAKFLYVRPRIEAAISALDKGRLKLPLINVHLLFDDFDEQPVVLKDLPFGPWSSPIADVVILAKIAKCLRPQNVLEVGSHRGHTTKLLAEHTPPQTRVVALDRDPRHGAAYRDSPLTGKIERRIGEVSVEAFAADNPGSYDLIFLDADHTYSAVRRDTELLLPLLAPSGIFVWHDYANWGRFSKKNGVPEYLHELAATRPVAALAGTWLAVYGPSWSSGDGAKRFARALAITGASEDAWRVDTLRG